jgi:hypothetical protein
MRERLLGNAASLDTQANYHFCFMVMPAIADPMGVELWPELSCYTKRHFRQSAPSRIHLARLTRPAERVRT